MISNRQTSNETSEVCWYCKRNPSNKHLAARIPMHNIIDAKYKSYGNVSTTRYNFQQMEIAVPRCEDCFRRHQSVTTITRGILIIFYIAGFITFAFAAATAFHWTNSNSIGNDLDRAGIIAIVGVILWIIAASVRPISNAIFTSVGPTKPESFGSKSPNVQKMLNEGWSVGKKP